MDTMDRCFDTIGDNAPWMFVPGDQPKEVWWYRIYRKFISNFAVPAQDSIISLTEFQFQLVIMPRLDSSLKFRGRSSEGRRSLGGGPLNDRAGGNRTEPG